MMKSVALVRVLGFDRYDFNSSDYNIGLRYLESIIKINGLNCDIFDPYDFSSDKGHVFITKDYTIVGFTVHIFNIEETLSLSKFIKLKQPHTYIILGGHHATATANDLLKYNHYIDAICCGEGEDVVENIAKKVTFNFSIKEPLPKGILKPGKCYNLDELDFPSVPKSTQIARLLTSRGCPYSCSFCTTPAFYHKPDQVPYTYRSAENIYNEILELKSKGYNQFKMNDDIFVLPSTESRLRLKNLSSKLIAAQAHISYEAEIRVDALNYNDLDLIVKAKNAGLKKLFLGIESGSDKILKEFNKKIKFHQCQEAVRLFNKAGIVISAGNILVSPNCDINDICNSIMGFKKLKLAYLFFKRVAFRVHCFPGTALEFNLDNENRLENKMRYLYRKYSFKNSRIEDVVCFFEESMPYYLKEIGTKIFNLRKTLLNKCYNERLSIDPLNSILFDFNNKASEILLDWFKYLPNKMVTKKKFSENFNEFLDSTKEIYHRLLSLN